MISDEEAAALASEYGRLMARPLWQGWTPEEARRLLLLEHELFNYRRGKREAKLKQARDTTRSHHLREPGGWLPQGRPAGMPKGVWEEALAEADRLNTRGG